MIGTRNDIEAVQTTESKRDINRTITDVRAITEALKDPLSKISRIGRELGRLIAIRTKKSAFHPHGEQKILMISPDIFTVLRTSPEEEQQILSLINITSKVCHIEIPLSEVGSDEIYWYDIVSGMEWMADDKKLFLTLQPYDIIWLEPLREEA